MSISIKWKHRISATNMKCKGAGMRPSLAWLLRSIADRIDGGKSLTYECVTTPPIGAKQESECIEQGFQHANRLLADMAHLQACENALKEHYKTLFADQPSGAGAIQH